MKLALIGGAGVRTPMLISGLIKWREEVQVDTLTIYDIDQERMDVIRALVSKIVKDSATPLKVEFTTDFKQAVQNAAFIYFAIRVGGERGRAIDERIPLKYGVLGQETTGPGGFAMAMRTIPVMLKYCEEIQKYAPDAWVINFTNPSGLIAQALRKYTKLKVIGICDGPSFMRLNIAKYLKCPPEEIYINYYGLNHLGWVNQVWAKGENVLPRIIADFDNFANVFTHMRVFSKQLIQSLKVLPNEYLYYFYYREQAVANILSSPQTRGEQIVELNEKLFKQLKEAINVKGDVEEAFRIYESIMGERSNSYMQAETGNAGGDEKHDAEMELEGYAGLAMSIISSIKRNKPTPMILNILNNGNISELQNDDVVEVPCIVDQNGPLPMSVGPVDEGVLGLLQTVKEYERYTVSAAVNGSYEDALKALAIHPLVNSFSLAKSILDGYIEAHGADFPNLQ